MDDIIMDTSWDDSQSDDNDELCSYFSKFSNSNNNGDKSKTRQGESDSSHAFTAVKRWEYSTHLESSKGYYATSAKATSQNNAARYGHKQEEYVDLVADGEDDDQQQSNPYVGNSNTFSSASPNNPYTFSNASQNNPNIFKSTSLTQSTSPIPSISSNNSIEVENDIQGCDLGSHKVQFKFVRKNNKLERVMYVAEQSVKAGETNYEHSDGGQTVLDCDNSSIGCDIPVEPEENAEDGSTTELRYAIPSDTEVTNGIDEQSGNVGEVEDIDDMEPPHQNILTEDTDIHNESDYAFSIDGLGDLDPEGIECDALNEEDHKDLFDTKDELQEQNLPERTVSDSEERHYMMMSPNEDLSNHGDETGVIETCDRNSDQLNLNYQTDQDVNQALHMKRLWQNFKPSYMRTPAPEHDTRTETGKNSIAVNGQEFGVFEVCNNNVETRHDNVYTGNFNEYHVKVCAAGEDYQKVDQEENNAGVQDLEESIVSDSEYTDDSDDEDNDDVELVQYFTKIKTELNMKKLDDVEKEKSDDETRNSIALNKLEQTNISFPKLEEEVRGCSQKFENNNDASSKASLSCQTSDLDRLATSPLKESHEQPNLRKQPVLDEETFLEQMYQKKLAEAKFIENEINKLRKKKEKAEMKSSSKHLKQKLDPMSDCTKSGPIIVRCELPKSATVKSSNTIAVNSKKQTQAKLGPKNVSTKQNKIKSKQVIASKPPVPIAMKCGEKSHKKTDIGQSTVYVSLVNNKVKHSNPVKSTFTKPVKKTSTKPGKQKTTGNLRKPVNKSKNTGVQKNKRQRSGSKVTQLIDSSVSDHSEYKQDTTIGEMSKNTGSVPEALTAIRSRRNSRKPKHCKCCISPDGKRNAHKGISTKRQVHASKSKSNETSDGMSNGESISKDEATSVINDLKNEVTSVDSKSCIPDQYVTYQEEFTTPVQESKYSSKLNNCCEEILTKEIVPTGKVGNPGNIKEKSVSLNSPRKRGRPRKYAVQKNLHDIANQSKVIGLNSADLVVLKKPGRPKQVKVEGKQQNQLDCIDNQPKVEANVAVNPPIKRKRSRPKEYLDDPDYLGEPPIKRKGGRRKEDLEDLDDPDYLGEPPIKKKRGRPKKYLGEPPVKRKGGRPKKCLDDPDYLGEPPIKKKCGKLKKIKTKSTLLNSLPHENVHPKFSIERCIPPHVKGKSVKGKRGRPRKTEMLGIPKNCLKERGLNKSETVTAAVNQLSHESNNLTESQEIVIFITDENGSKSLQSSNITEAEPFKNDCVVIESPKHIEAEGANKYVMHSADRTNSKTTSGIQGTAQPKRRQKKATGKKLTKTKNASDVILIHDGIKSGTGIKAKGKKQKLDLSNGKEGVKMESQNLPKFAKKKRGKSKRVDTFEDDSIINSSSQNDSEDGTGGKKWRQVKRKISDTILMKGLGRRRRGRLPRYVGKFKTVLKKTDKLWKEKLEDGAFEFDFNHGDIKKKRPIDVKKMIQQILKPPEKVEGQDVGKQEWWRRKRRHHVHKHLHTGIGSDSSREKRVTDSDEGWISDNSAPTAFPGFQLKTVDHDRVSQPCLNPRSDSGYWGEYSSEAGGSNDPDYVTSDSYTHTGCSMSRNKGNHTGNSEQIQTYPRNVSYVNRDTEYNTETGIDKNSVTYTATKYVELYDSPKKDSTSSDKLGGSSNMELSCSDTGLTLETTSPLISLPVSPRSPADKIKSLLDRRDHAVKQLKFSTSLSPVKK